MEPTDQPPLKPKGLPGKNSTAIEFLPDADAIERSPLPPYIRITMHVLALAVLAFVVWASVSEVERVVVAQGHLVNPLPNIVVQPLETSIIQKIEVRVGQVVRQGEVLATLDPTFAKADEAQLRSRLESLNTQSRGLNGELLGSPDRQIAKDADGALQAQLSRERLAHYAAQLAKLEQNIGRVAASIETNQRDQQVLNQRMKSLAEMEAMQESLMAQQFGARLQLLEARDRRLSGERELQLANNKEHELRSELAAIQSEKLAFSKSWRQKTMEDKRRQLVSLVSPVDAVVLDMAKLSQGSVVQAAEKMFTLVPLGASMEAEVKIDSVDIGYIKTGDLVHVKLDAFPFQKHGSLDGLVRTISEDAFRREASAAPAGLDAFYVTRISYGDSKLKKMTDKSRLLPGMTLSAEIVVGKRSVMSYLLWPLTKALDESIREP